MRHDRVKCDASPVRRATEAGVRGIWFCPVFMVDEWHYLVQQKARVVFAVNHRYGRRQSVIGKRQIFLRAIGLAGVVDSNDDEGSNFPAADQFGRSLIHSPLFTAEYRCTGVE